MRKYLFMGVLALCVGLLFGCKRTDDGYSRSPRIEKKVVCKPKLVTTAPDGTKLWFIDTFPCTTNNPTETYFSSASCSVKN